MERFQESFKDKEFRKLFFDYMDEISDPNNRALYEKEIAMLEAEKGNDVQFINPVAGHVIKTNILTSNGSKTKVFINICSSSLVEVARINKTTANKSLREKGNGQGWSIPYSLGSPRDDVDHANTACQVYDCVFHPDTLRMAETNEAYAKMLAQTAIEGIENQFKVSLSRDFKRLQMKSKGTPVSTIIRSKNSNFVPPKTETSLEFVEKVMSNNKAPKTNEKSDTQQSSTLIEEILPLSSAIESPDLAKPQIPRYTIIQRDSHNDYQKFTNDKQKNFGSRPDSIVIKISLPGIRSAVEAELDVTSFQLELKCSTKYALSIDLPFPVFSDNGSAKFDKQRSELSITLPVVPAPTPLHHSTADEVCLDVTEQEVSIRSDDDGVETKGTEEHAANNEISIDISPLPANTTEKSDVSVNEPSESEQTEKDLVACFNKQLKLSTISCATPPFRLTQHRAIASIVFDVENIVNESVSFDLSEDEAIVEFRTHEQQWGIHFKFETPIDVARSKTIDVSSKNAIISLRKYNDNHTPWQQITSFDFNGASLVTLLSTFKHEESRMSENTSSESQSSGSSAVNIKSASAKLKGNDQVVVDITYDAKKSDDNSKPKEKLQLKNNLLFELD